MSEGIERLVVPPGTLPSRVDAFIARSLPGISRTYAKALARGGKVRSTGRVLAPSDVVHPGDILEVEVPRPDLDDLPSLRVLREDADVVYVHKPAAVHTVRLRPDDPPTLADGVAARYPECRHASPDPREAGALHRLDLHTTGVVAFARSPEAWARGRAALGGAWKLYLARATEPAPSWPPPPSTDVALHDPPARWPEGRWPCPAEPGVRVTAPLAASGPRGRRMMVDPGGQPAASRVWSVDPAHSLFAVQLLTGRRHQVRVHMASLGLPLWGDSVYGPAPPGAAIALHAWAFQLGPTGPVVVAEPPPWCAA